MDIQNLTNVSTVVINSLLMLLKDNHVDVNSVVMQLSNNKDEAISPGVNLGELAQQTLGELQKAKTQKVAVPEGFVLDKPAKVANGNFGIGVKWSTVIGAAQRQFEYAQNDVSEKVNIQNLKGVLFDVPEGFVLVSKSSISEAVEKIEQLFEEDSLLALGELLPIQQGLKTMIEAQEPTND